MIPAGADKVVFLLAPLITSILALAAWAVVPIDFGWALADVNVGILYIFAICSLSVYGIIMGGWASNNEIRLPRRASLGGADGLATKSRSAS